MNPSPSLQRQVFESLFFAMLTFSLLAQFTIANAEATPAVIESYIAQQGGVMTGPIMSNGVPQGTVMELASHIAGSQSADFQCVAGDYTCDFPAVNPKGVQCMRNFVCWQVTNGFTTTGLCQAPNYCVGKAPKGAIGSALEGIGDFMKENPLISGIGLGAGMSLFQSMMSGSGSSGSGSGSSYGGYGTGICTTQYYYSANPNPADPCAVYSSTGSGSSLPTSGAEDTSLADLINQLNQNQNLPVGSSSQTSLTDVLSGEKCPIVSSLVSCAAGDVMQEQGLDANGCKQDPICTPAVDIAGGDDVNLSPAESGTVVPVADLIYNPNLYVDTTSGATPDPSQTPLAKHEVPQNGLHGDLLSFGGGVTIYARSRTGNTEISGFYGGGTSSGLCKSRPWADNFLSYIIPPAFFDNLCAWSGFGQTSSQLSPGDWQSGSRSVSGPRSPSTPIEAPPSELVPEAHIRASPESVNLGGRTTVFWTSRNVASCEEMSSDGNFHGTTVAGGASTVALSGAVTFYIDCLGLSGERVTDSFTVQIGI